MKLLGSETKRLAADAVTGPVDEEILGNFGALDDFRYV